MQTSNFIDKSLYSMYFCQESLFQNVQFCPRSRKAKILTTGIHLVFRGLKFEPNAGIEQKGTFCKGLAARASATPPFSHGGTAGSFNVWPKTANTKVPPCLKRWVCYRMKSPRFECKQVILLTRVSIPCTFIKRACFKMFNFVQGQERRKF